MLNSLLKQNDFWNSTESQCVDVSIATGNWCTSSSVMWQKYKYYIIIMIFGSADALHDKIIWSHVQRYKILPVYAS